MFRRYWMLAAFCFLFLALSACRTTPASSPSETDTEASGTVVTQKEVDVSQTEPDTEVKHTSAQSDTNTEPDTDSEVQTAPAENDTVHDVATLAPDPHVVEPQSDLLGQLYGDMTRDQMIRLYQDTNTRYGGLLGKNYNTPLYYVTDTHDGYYVYNKVTGEVEANDFAYGARLTDMTVTNDRIYLLYTFDDSRNIIWSVDFDFNDPQEVKSWPEMVTLPDKIYGYKNCLYYSVMSRKESLNNSDLRGGEDDYSILFAKYDLSDGKETVIAKTDGSNIGAISAMIGKYAYYSFDENGVFLGEIRRYDVETGEDICVVPGSVRDAGVSECEFMFSAVTPDKKMIRFVFEDMNINQDDRAFWYNTETGELTQGHYGLIIGEYEYYIKREIAAGHENDPNGGTQGAKKYERFGQLRRSHIGTGQEEPVLTVTFNGEPGAVSSLSYIGRIMEYDGRYLYVEYLERCDVSKDVSCYLTLIDPENQEVYGIPVEHEVSWYPDRQN